MLLIMACKKQNTISFDNTKPTVLFVSTNARVLDTAAFLGKRYMHFLISIDVITGDSSIYFSQLPIDHSRFVRLLGPDTVHEFTLYRPLLLTTLPEVIPESDVYEISANDTARITYFGMVIAHGRWTQFYMEAYRFPYSLGQNDGTYESFIEFSPSYKTNMPL